MGSAAGFEYGIVSVCVVYYAARFGLNAISRKEDKKYYVAFFAVALSTVLLCLVYIVNKSPQDKVIQLTMMWSVVGPIVDLLWQDMWPGSGSLVLWLAQIIFVLRAGAFDTPYGLCGVALLSLSTILFALGAVLKKGVIALFYPPVHVLSPKDL